MNDMDITVQVNMVAVLLCTVASMVIGMAWYSQTLFGKQWMKLAKIKMGDGNMLHSMGTAVVSSFLMAWVLAHLSYLAHTFYNNSFLTDAVTTAFWVWVGFFAVRMFMRGEFNLRRKKETLIHVGNELVTLLVMGLIIGQLGIK